jgi:hypothetical protein
VARLAPALSGFVATPSGVLVAAAAGTAFRGHVGKVVCIALYRAMRRCMRGQDALSDGYLEVFLYTPYVDNFSECATVSVDVPDKNQKKILAEDRGMP